MVKDDTQVVALIERETHTATLREMGYVVVEVPVPVTVGSQEQVAQVGQTPEQEFICVEQSQIVVVAAGQQGPPGPNGKTAYQVWLEEGHTGSESDFFSFLKGAKGDKGDQGDRGLPGAASPTYVHDQAVPLDVWVIDHPLSKFPSVTYMDSAGDEIDGILSYDSLDRVTVTFGAATGGKAYLN